MTALPLAARRLADLAAAHAVRLVDAPPCSHAMVFEDDWKALDS